MRGRTCATVFVVGPAPPFFFLGCLVVCVYAWVVCSAREGGSRPLLLVYLPVRSVLRFRERASVAVAGFGKVGGRVVGGWWFSSPSGFAPSQSSPMCCASLSMSFRSVSRPFRYSCVASLSSPFSSCQSSVTMRVLVPSMVFAVVRVSRLLTFSSKSCFCSSDSEFHARVVLRVAHWPRVCLCGWCACLMGRPMFRRSPRCRFA